MNYVPLYVKTSYSLLSSLCDIKKLIKKSKELDIKKIAITDDNMYGVMEFYKECIKNDIKPIIGLEIEFNSDKILLYAKNYKGYQNLTRLIYKKQNKVLELEDLILEDIILVCLNKKTYDLFSSKTKELYLIEDLREVKCIEKQDVKYLKYLYLIKDSKKLENIEEYSINEDCYLNIEKSNNYKVLNEIADKCNIKFEKNDLMPKYSNNSKQLLFELCKKGLIKRLDNKVTKKYYDRLMYELNVINNMNYNDYFLVVYDFIKYSRKNNILVGPGRGSAAGSLVSYCLGITQVDPIKYDLLFERFLNIERITMPDIDIDFESNNREKVVEYVINKYSKKNAVLIVTFTTLTNKQVLRDVGRILNINIKHIDNLSKIINIKSSLEENYKENNIFSKYIRDNNLEELYEISKKLENLKRQISIHAAGVIISDKELDSYIPLEKYDNHYISAFSMEHLEELGILKIDFLGLKNLTLIEDVTNKLNINKDFNIVEDEKTLDIFKKGLTEGIFQFESEGMKNFLKKLKPNKFDDIVAAIALYRPGPSLNIDSYIKRKEGIEKIDYIHEDLEEILKPTYGIIIYQEQIMQIANKIANYSYSQADLLRRAMSKKIKDILIKEEEVFIKRSIENNYKQELAKKIYDLILKFANYGFNKSHSVAYAMISYKMAYLKANYTNYFMSSLLTNSIGNEVKTKEYIDECKKLDITVIKPNINLSKLEYIVKDNNILFPISNIKGIGTVISKSIIDNQPYIDFFDFVKKNYKVLNKKALENLIFSGCFNDNKKVLINSIDSAFNYASLSNSVDESFIEKPQLIDEKEFDKSYLLEKELEIFGFYFDSNFLKDYKKSYENLINTNDIEKNFDKLINIVVMVKKIKIVNTKNNDKMAFVNCIDEFKNVDITIFPNNYSYVESLNLNDIVFISGKVEKRLSKYQVVVNKMEKLN